MARRKSLLTRLSYLDWRLSIALALVIFVVFGKLLPMTAFQDLKLVWIVRAASRLAPFFSLLMLAAAMRSFIRRRDRRRLLASLGQLDDIRKLSLTRFIALAGEIFRRKGYVVWEHPYIERRHVIHLRMKKNGRISFVLCSNQKTGVIGLAYVHHLFSLTMAHGADAAVVITSGDFTGKARRYAANKPMDLIDGTKLGQLLTDVQDPTG